MSLRLKKIGHEVTLKKELFGAVTMAKRRIDRAGRCVRVGRVLSCRYGSGGDCVGGGIKTLSFL